MNWRRGSEDAIASWNVGAKARACRPPVCTLSRPQDRVRLDSVNNGLEHTLSDRERATERIYMAREQHTAAGQEELEGKRGHRESNSASGGGLGIPMLAGAHNNFFSQQTIENERTN